MLTRENVVPAFAVKAPKPGASGRPMLESWKEIAAYLGKGVRTVQRWERDLGLPVCHPGQGRRMKVHTSAAELDRWLASQWAVRMEADEPSGPAGESKLVSQTDSEICELVRLNRELRRNLQQAATEVSERCQSLTRSLQFFGKR